MQMREFATIVEGMEEMACDSVHSASYCAVGWMVIQLAESVMNVRRCHASLSSL